MTFNYQPTLQGEKTILRPLRTEDFTALHEAASDPLIWVQHPQRNRYKEDVFRDFFDGALHSDGALVVIDTATQKIIGSSRFFGFNEATSEIEIGWTFLARSFWGGTYNREVKKLMLAHAFQGVDNVVFLIGPENMRSQAAIQKIGGVRIADRSRKTGDLSFVFRICREDFNKI